MYANRSSRRRIAPSRPINQSLISVLVVLVLLASMALSLAVVGFAQPTQRVAVSDSDTELLFTIPLTDEGVSYKGGDVQETLVTGPASLRIAPDGSILVTDTVGRKVLHYNSQGKKIGTINVESSEAVTNVVFDGYNFFVLDESAPQPVVYRLSAAGEVQTKIALASELREQGLSGLWKNDDGEVLVELQGGSSVAGFDGRGRDGKSLKGAKFTTDTPDFGNNSAQQKPVIRRNGKSLSIDVNNILGGMTVLGAGPQGDFFVLLDELSNTHKLAVDQTVRHYDASGRLLEMARVPVSERHAYVRNGVALSPNGRVYALVTRKDQVDVVRLKFKQSLKPILPESEPLLANAENVNKRDRRLFSHAVAKLVVPQTSCSRTRDQMINTAWAYINNQTYLTTTNLNGTCSGRSKPRYLGTSAGYVSSVPYDWGGYDTVEQYNSYMAQGYQAGDLDTNGIESCSRGVDCSGFVSRAWGTARYTTSTLPSISTAISVSQLQRGDIINLAGSHVAMFNGLSNGGVNTLEATAYNSYDRVVAIWNGWSRFNGYKFYRYNSVCDSGPPKLTGKSPTYIYASSLDQTVYFQGTNLTNTAYMYVQFPSGAAAYIYPPTQIFSRSYSQLGCKIKFGTRGQYYIWTYTSDGGWSNALGVVVY